MRGCIAVVLFVCLIFVADAQLPFLRRGLGGNLGITQCNARTNPSATIPASFDAREKWPECIQPIRDQGSCGSCWAFATASATTDRFCIAALNSENRIKRMLAPQDLVSCDNTCKGILSNSCQSGCSGGYLDVAMNYIIDTGIVGDSCYPYLGSETTCAASQCKNGTSANNQKFKNKNCYKLDGISNIQYDIMTYGPIVAGFTVYEDFFGYTSGVYIKSSSESAGGHAVKIVGWGTENGVDYWLAANSWTANWGDQGYFKIRRGTNECSIEDNMVGGEVDLSSVSAQYEEYPSTTPQSSPASSPLASISPILSPSGNSIANSALSLFKIWSLLLIAGVLLLF